LKIVHICQYYNEGYSYQENLLPRSQANLGHEVVLITSDRRSPILGRDQNRIVGTKTCYEGNVKIIRLSIKREFKGRFVCFSGLFDQIEKEKPDFIFHHGITSPSIFELIKYKQKYRNVKLVLDNHADYCNTGKIYVWLLMYYRHYWKNKIRNILNEIDWFFSITPDCKRFAEKELGVPSSNHSLLPLGVDERIASFSEEWRERVRNMYGFNNNDLIIITIGRLTKEKRIEHIINAMKVINNIHIKLIIVGPFEKKYEKRIDAIIGQQNGIFVKIGWVDSKQIFKYFSAADIAIFTGGQSVLWQQAISSGLPVIAKYWPVTLMRTSSIPLVQKACLRY